MAHHEEDHHYHPKDAVLAAINTAKLTGGVGLFAAAVQTTLTKQNVGTMGVFIRNGSTISTFGEELRQLMFSIAWLLIFFLLVAIGATYEFIKTASANLREREDHYNVALGGFFSGAILGLRRKSGINPFLSLQWGFRS